MGEELEGFEPSHQELNSVKYTKQCSVKGPACIKTHLPWVLLPKEIRGDIKRPKVSNCHIRHNYYICNDIKCVECRIFETSEKLLIYLYNSNRLGIEYRYKQFHVL